MTSVTVSGAREAAANVARIDQTIDQVVRRQIVASALRTQNTARQYAPVDTGRLRNSITHEIRAAGLTAVVGTNVHYAIYQEFGTRFIPGRFYLSRAFEQERVRMPTEFAQAVNMAINSAAA